jgi:hypothetical protein
MCDFRPEDATTFWTAAMYCVTEGSTPTAFLEKEIEGNLG